MVRPPPNHPATPTSKPKHMRVLAKIDIFHERRTNVELIVKKGLLKNSGKKVKTQGLHSGEEMQ